MRNKVNVAIRQAKELFYKNKFSESDGDPRKTWQVINELTCRKTGRSSIRELTLNGVSITNSAALLNAFNDHFSTIVSKLASEIVNGSLSECCTLKCGFPQVTILRPSLFLLYINYLPDCRILQCLSAFQQFFPDFHGCINSALVAADSIDLFSELQDPKLILR